MDLAILCTHHSIQHFIEVNEAIIDIYTHFEDNALNILLRGFFTQIHVLMHRWRKTAEKAVNMTDLYLHALESRRISLPCCFETFKVFFKAGQWIIILNVVLAELLNDHQNKEVEHNVSHDKDEGEEEEWGQRCSTGLPRNAVWWQSHAVIHNSVPVLAC